MLFLSNSELAVLRHQIAAAIDGSLTGSVEPKNAADTAAAAAYAAQRKSVKMVAGAWVDGDLLLPQDQLFFNWINGGGGVIASAALPDFILGLVRQFLNRSGINQKGG